MLSFPPHCSHTLQPLDHTVVGPFKKYVRMSQDNWLETTQEKQKSIQDLPGIARESWPKAAQPSSITKRFELYGVFPFNNKIFTVVKFAPSIVTNRLLSKIVSMIKKYHNHKLQTNPWYCKEEPHNNNETPGRQTKQSNQLSLPHRDDCKTRMDRKKRTTKHLMAITKIKRPATRIYHWGQKPILASVIEVQEYDTNRTWMEKRGGKMLKCVVMATVYYMPSTKASKKTRLPICQVTNSV